VPDAQNAQREFALSVVKRLRDAGHEALWAGGCVRDQLIGLPPKDYDVATSARPDAVRDLFGHRRTLAIGAAFGVITVLGAKPLQPIEVATFRTDGEYRDGRRPESVAFTDARHDAERRDFTINGLFFDPLAEQVVDYVGGAADLEARVVRAIGDPLSRFTEDRLRMLRAVRFAATYDFALDLATFQAIRTMAGDVASVSGERIGAELRRILVHANRRRGAELLAETALLQQFLPEVAPHAVAGNAVWQTALKRLEALREPTFPAALAALLHGSVPPADVREVARRLRLSNNDADRVQWLVQHVDEMLAAATLSWPVLQRLLAHAGAAELLALAEATVGADDPGLVRCRERLALPAHEWNPPPLVTGNDLMAHGLKSGPHFAALLEHLRDEQLEGRLRAREEALAEAKRWMESRPADGRR
jgi:poly(A) polymerase